MGSSGFGLRGFRRNGVNFFILLFARSVWPFFLKGERVQKKWTQRCNTASGEALPKTKGGGGGGGEGLFFGRWG